jgi:LysR family glycine cleavage system transcriptional activator
MPRPLPPLSALLAFEAVARRLSFSRAAEELHVTPGAVSQQIKALEERVGEPLFERTRRTVGLTSAARAMLPDVQAGLHLLSRAVEDKATASANGRSLTISVAPSFASKWLLPRLPQLAKLHPGIDLRISATVSLAEFGRDGPDLAIRFGRGQYGDLHSERLLPESLTPMCSPAMPGARALKRPGDLRRVPLLHDTSVPGAGDSGAWSKWFELAGETGVPVESGMRFSLAEHALQAAIDGAGVVLGRLCLAEGDLAAHRLVRPFKQALQLDVGYHLVMPRRRRERADVQRFREWLLGEVRRSAVTMERPAARLRSR